MRLRHATALALVPVVLVACGSDDSSTDDIAGSVETTSATISPSTPAASFSTANYPLVAQNNAQFASGGSFGIIYTNQQFIDGHPSATEDFMRATMRGLADAIADPDALQNELDTYAPSPFACEIGRTAPPTSAHKRGLGARRFTAASSTGLDRSWLGLHRSQRP